VTRTQRGVRAAVDRLRSFPLFYSSGGPLVRLSDRATMLVPPERAIVLDRIATWNSNSRDTWTGDQTLVPSFNRFAQGTRHWTRLGLPGLLDRVFSHAATDRIGVVSSIVAKTASITRCWSLPRSGHSGSRTSRSLTESVLCIVPQTRPYFCPAGELCNGT
jgi:hypothetical protein